MNMCNSNKWQLRITHIPTGITVIRDNSCFRNQHQAGDAAMRYLRSKLYMLGTPLMKESELLFEEIEDTERQ